MAKKISAVTSLAPTIVTPNLILRALTMNDAHDVFAYASDPDVAQFTQWNAHTSLDDTYAFIASTHAYCQLKQTLVWGIEHTSDKKIIGECGFAHIVGTQAELYYALSKKYWGKGLATQATTAIVNFGFNSMDFTRIEAWIIAQNTNSHRVAQKVGMHHETVLHNHWYTDAALHDIHVYAKEIQPPKMSTKKIRRPEHSPSV